MAEEYNVRVIRDEAGFTQLEDAWARLLEASKVGSIFSSFPWNIAWWHAFGGDNRLYILVATDIKGEVRGIAPLMLRRDGLLRRLEFLGTGLSDTGDFLLDAECREPVAQAIFAFLRRRRPEWDLLDLDEVPSYSPLVPLLEERKPPGLHLIKLPRTECPYIPLPPTWEEYIHTLGRKPRQHLESFARRVVQESGAYYRSVMTEVEAPAAVDRFYELHLARWSAKDADLNPEHRSSAFLPFLREVCTGSARHGLLRLSELCVGEKPIASWISFQVNGRLNGYMTGFDPEWSSKRPGKILHGFVVRQALAEHSRELDFGRGAEEYKYEMGAINRRNQRFIVSNNMLRSLVVFSLTVLRFRARDMVRRYRKT